MLATRQTRPLVGRADSPRRPDSPQRRTRARVRALATPPATHIAPRAHTRASAAVLANGARSGMGTMGRGGFRRIVRRAPFRTTCAAPLERSVSEARRIPQPCYANKSYARPL